MVRERWSRENYDGEDGAQPESADNSREYRTCKVKFVPYVL